MLESAVGIKPRYKVTVDAGDAQVLQNTGVVSALIQAPTCAFRRPAESLHKIPTIPELEKGHVEKQAIRQVWKKNRGEVHWNCFS